MEVGVRIQCGDDLEATYIILEVVTLLSRGPITSFAADAPSFRAVCLFYCHLAVQLLCSAL